MTDALVVQSPKAERPKRFRRRALVIGVAVVVVATVTTTWFVQWRSSLHPFQSYPMYGSDNHLLIGQTYYYGGEALSSHPSEFLTVHIDSVRPVITENTAKADIVVFRCTFGSHRLFGPLGEDAQSSRFACPSLTAFRSGTISIKAADGGDDLVIAITPRQTGVVRMSGVQVRYHSGLRHGSQHVGAAVSVTTRSTAEAIPIMTPTVLVVPQPPSGRPGIAT